MAGRLRGLCDTPALVARQPLPPSRQNLPRAPLPRTGASVRSEVNRTPTVTGAQLEERLWESRKHLS